ncbi:MAG: RNA polymerase sigma factor [Acidobacteria bacterium]|nr:RNA polymerase sigma factor [Acidobacteriota bacterium]
MTATQPQAASDIDLVRLAQAGDADAFGELVERNRRVVFRAALAAVGTPAEADDVAQEAFVAAYQKLHSFRGDAAFRTWLLAITWRKAIDRRKSVTRWLKRTVTSFDAQGEEIGDPIDRLTSRDPSQEQTLSAAELERHVRRLIGTLPRKLRDALLLAGSGDHSYEQMSAMLGIPVGTVKWRVSEARRVLKQKLVTFGYSND